MEDPVTTVKKVLKFISRDQQTETEYDPELIVELASYARIREVHDRTTEDTEKRKVDWIHIESLLPSLIL